MFSKFAKFNLSMLSAHHITALSSALHPLCTRTSVVPSQEEGRRVGYECHLFGVAYHACPHEKCEHGTTHAGFWPCRRSPPGIYAYSKIHCQGLYIFIWKWSDSLPFGLFFFSSFFLLNFLLRAGADRSCVNISSNIHNGLDLIFADILENLPVPNISTEFHAWNKLHKSYYECLFTFAKSNLYDHGVIVRMQVFLGSFFIGLTLMTFTLPKIGSGWLIWTSKTL